MVRFIVPLQSPKASANWSTVSRFCNYTLASIANQTTTDFEVVLVCNEVPENFKPHEKIKVILTDLPPPTGRGQIRMEDKWKKVRIGLANYRSSADAYYMVVDADDRVSKHLARFVTEQDYKPGWFVDKGYVYDYGFPWIFNHNRLDLLCGTSSIVFCEAHLLPTGSDDKAAACPIVTYGHTGIKRHFDEAGTPLKALPFRGSIYVSHTGENDSGHFYLGIKSMREQVKRLFKIRPVTKRIKDDYTLWDV
jgi:hypothetical protein